MGKVKDFFKKWFTADSILHFLACYAMTMTLSLFLYPLISFAITMFIGFMKEILWDNYLEHGMFEWKDIAFDTAGALIAMAIMFIF